MNWAWAAPLDHLWRSQSLPIWVTLAAAGFFGVIVLITMVRAERSVATGALTVITLLAIGIAVAAVLRSPETSAAPALAEARASPATVVALPALSCIDDLAGDVVGPACERVLFGSPDSTAAAVSYAASMLSRLTALGDAAVAQRSMTREMQAVRRAVERDRYGLMAHVLLARDRCTSTQCSAYRSLTDNHRIIANMDEHAFDNLVARYSPSWNSPQANPGAGGPLAMLPPSLPTGRPTNAEFPSSASTPPISIMTPEPGTGAKPPAPVAAAAAPAAPAAPAARAAQASVPPPPAAAKKPPAAKRATAPPIPISPAQQAPATSED